MDNPQPLLAPPLAWDQLAMKRFIDVGTGVIDSDYKVEVGVVLFNHLHEGFNVQVED